MIRTNNLTLALALRVTGMPVAFDPGTAGWKKDADGKIVTNEAGDPIYVNTAGQELSLGTDTVARLNNEAKTNRERAEEAERKLKPFEGLDAAAAKDAIDKLSKVDQKKLIDSGEVDKVRTEVSKLFEGQIAEKDKTNAELSSRVETMTRNNAFRSSKFIADQIAVPADMIQATFGGNFKVEGDKLVPYYANGEKVYSKKRGGEVADFDEALEIIVDGYAHKDHILKGGNHSGSGNQGKGGTTGGGRIVRREAFEAMGPVDQANTAEAASKGELTIAD